MYVWCCLVENLCTLSKLRSWYHRCVKIFFGFRRRDSMTSVLMTLGLPSFNIVLGNASSLSFAKQWANCSNSIIRVMRNMDLNYCEWCLYFTLFHFIFPVCYIYVCRLSVVISFYLCICMLLQFVCLFACRVFMGHAAWNKMHDDRIDIQDD